MQRLTIALSATALVGADLLVQRHSKPRAHALKHDLYGTEAGTTPRRTIT
jgi:hypothetical protein